VTTAYATNHPERCCVCGTHRAATWTVFTAKGDALRGKFCRRCSEREIQRENEYAAQSEEAPRSGMLLRHGGHGRL
jgi:hypothetical protein